MTLGLGLILLVGLVILLGGVLLGSHFESLAWNHGECLLCGRPWEHFDTDSQGGRGYCCRNHYKTYYGPWISYPWIDKT